jgi:DNA-binding winged helix-turn-helix (wHTH) protein/predicted negative regulator of RcsB-dependent stress response
LRFLIDFLCIRAIAPAGGAVPARNATIHRFGACELDEGRRALRAHGREIDLQPRVFDLLVYLVRNRERVVSKQELLDRLWPGTLVVDNALQRVVSLARSALAEGGARAVLRTYSRHGYRFCAEEARGGAPEAAQAGGPALVRAHRADAAREWSRAIEAFAEADRERTLGPDDFEEWGRVAIWAGRGSEAIAPLERAVAQRAAAGDRTGAARAALLLAQIRSERMEAAIAGGLINRAASLLETEGPSAEHGHLAWVAARLALMQGDLRETLRHAEDAYESGRNLGDPDHECLGLLYRGHALIGLGEVAKGVALHDEAAAAVIAGEVSPWVGGIVYCGIISATRNRCDWQRAGQWTDEFTRWCDASGMPAFPGTCRLHRAEVLCVRGDLDEGAGELEELAALLARIAPWAEGDAYRVLGDIRLTQGELGAAEAAFRKAHALGWEPQPGLALLQLAQGRPDAALRGLQRALEDGNWVMRERRGQLLATLVSAALAAGQPGRARGALEELTANPELWSTPAVAAMAARARAEVALEDGQRNEAAAQLRRALQHWHEIGSPLNAADVRLRLADLLLAEGDRDAAELELAAAESLLKKSSAGPLRARCTQVRRTLQD